MEPLTGSQRSVPIAPLTFAASGCVRSYGVPSAPSTHQPCCPNTEPAANSGTILARATVLPTLVVIRNQSPVAIPRWAASCDESSTIGSGISRRNDLILRCWL